MQQMEAINFRLKGEKFTMKNKEKMTYTVTEMAQVLKIGKNKAYELVKTEGFPVVYIGSTIRIPIKALNRWLNDSEEYL